MTFDINSLSESEIVAALRNVLLTPAQTPAPVGPAPVWRARERHPERECVTLWITGRYTAPKTGEVRAANPIMLHEFRNAAGERIACDVLGAGRNYIPLEFWEHTEVRSNDLLGIMLEQGEAIVLPPGKKLPKGFRLDPDMLESLENVCFLSNDVSELEDALELLPAKHPARKNIEERIAAVRKRVVDKRSAPAAEQA